METIIMGSMYFDNEVMPIGSKWNGKPLKVGDTDQKQPITWIKVNGLLVSNRSICCGISWNDLINFGFLYGSPVEIDGKSYLCRSLNADVKGSNINEWDTIIDATDERDDLWHWGDMYFWSQGKSKDNKKSSVVRGGLMARHWGTYHADYRGNAVGFRPVLETLVPNDEISDSLIGNKLKIYCKDGNVEGMLLDQTEYDIILNPEKIGRWSYTLPDGNIIIDRNTILYTCEI